MDSKSFHLDVISGVGSLYSGTVKSVRVTGSEGEMGIRYGHTPLLTTIKTGKTHKNIKPYFFSAFFISRLSKKYLSLIITLYFLFDGLLLLKYK